MKMPNRQRGMTLVMALVMLVVLTLLALTSFNLGKSNLLIVSNMQQRDETMAAAREVIEETISSTRLFDDPENILANPCKGEANTRCVDTNGDGVSDVTVAITPAPTCAKAQAIKVSELDLTVKNDQDCSRNESDDLRGLPGAVSGDSLCANSVWDVNVIATDDVTQASVQVTQGVAVRIPKDSIDTNCP